MCAPSSRAMLRGSRRILRRETLIIRCRKVASSSALARSARMASATPGDWILTATSRPGLHQRTLRVPEQLRVALGRTRMPLRILLTSHPTSQGGHDRLPGRPHGQSRYRRRATDPAIRNIVLPVGRPVVRHTTLRERHRPAVSPRVELHHPPTRSMDPPSPRLPGADDMLSYFSTGPKARRGSRYPSSLAEGHGPTGASRTNAIVSALRIGECADAVCPRRGQMRI
jgi:hypothetical protein